MIYATTPIGITSDLKARKASHERNNPGFKIMCPIYEESNPRSDMAFHRLEKDAIKELKNGIVNPLDSSKKMECKNYQGGSLSKNWLYVLIG